MTGWRVGWTIAPPDLTGAIRKVHDFLTVGAPAPLQEAGAAALRPARRRTTRAWPRSTRERRDLMMQILEETGFEAHAAAGRLLRDGRLSHLGLGDDVAFARHLIEEIGVAAVPGSPLLLRAVERRHTSGSRSPRSSRRSRPRPNASASSRGSPHGGRTQERPTSDAPILHHLAGRSPSRDLSGTGSSGEGYSTTRLSGAGTSLPGAAAGSARR